MHAGYSRYFTPPPVENVSGSTVAEFDGTSNESATPAGQTRSRPSARIISTRAISQKIAPVICRSAWTAITNRPSNQLDDGLFGQTLILSAFNYAKGKVYGVEFTSSYTVGGFSAYANVAYSVAQGKNWNSAQFLFDPADIGLCQNSLDLS